jgi:hypothetical protein
MKTHWEKKLERLGLNKSEWRNFICQTKKITEKTKNLGQALSEIIFKPFPAPEMELSFFSSISLPQI